MQLSGLQVCILRLVGSYRRKSCAALQMAWEQEQRSGKSHDDGDFVGPPPPDVAAEAEGTSSDVRSAEVLRIVRCARACCDDASLGAEL